jgi:hypothetical protein
MPSKCKGHLIRAIARLRLYCSKFYIAYLNLFLTFILSTRSLVSLQLRPSLSSIASLSLSCSNASVLDFEIESDNIPPCPRVAVVLLHISLTRLIGFTRPRSLPSIVSVLHTSCSGLACHIFVAYYVLLIFEEHSIPPRLPLDLSLIRCISRLEKGLGHVHKSLLQRLKRNSREAQSSELYKKYIRVEKRV